MVLGSTVRGAAAGRAGLAALRAAGDIPQYQLALRVAGLFWVFADEPERALEHTTEALAIARGRPHLDDLGLALVGHATVLVELGRLDEAEALLDEAAPLLARARREQRRRRTGFSTSSRPPAATGRARRASSSRTRRPRSATRA